MSKSTHLTFEVLPVADKCTWYGTEWVGEGKESRLLECGEPTVGAGLFCSPGHIICEYHSVCERHKRTIDSWSNKT